MTRYIDADALKEYIDSCGCCARCKKISFNCQAECEFPDYLTDEWQRVIDEQPTVEAVPVVHGAWRSTEGLYTNGICYCSVCETEYYFSDLYDVGEEAQSRLPYFCPHCGAMMNWEEVATDNAKMDGEA